MVVATATTEVTLTATRMTYLPELIPTAVIRPWEVLAHSQALLAVLAVTAPSQALLAVLSHPQVHILGLVHIPGLCLLPLLRQLLVSVTFLLSHSLLQTLLDLRFKSVNRSRFMEEVHLNPPNSAMVRNLNQANLVLVLHPLKLGLNH